MSSYGLPCPAALAKGLGPVVAARLQIKSVRVSGTTALARVHSSAANQAPSDDNVELVKLGGHWYVQSLVGAGRGSSG